MSDGFHDDSIGEITKLLQDYFDGLYDGDLDKFGRLFHPNAHLYATDGSALTDLSREQYFELIASRKSPRAQNLTRYDRIVSIHKSGPDTALATVNCAIPPRYFTDYLTLVRTAHGWQIISKTYHAVIHE
jgi:hypothetical protein